MELLAKATIRGRKTWVGNMDGKNLDTGTIYIDVDLRGEDAAGIYTDAYKCENSAVVKAVAHNPLPFIAELTIVETSNGKAGGTQKIVTSIKPLAREVKVEKA
jgi:hypothetical protein